jgi:hypothetical protein
VGRSGRKGWLFYPCAAVHDHVGGIAMGISGQASSICKRWFNTKQICRKTRGKVVGHAPGTMLCPWISDTRSTVFVTPLSFLTPPEP